MAKADIHNLPFKDNAFDFVYTFGVLHHLPEPEKGLRSICEKIKPGGYAIIYVYEDFSQRSKLERILLKSVSTLRFFTTRMPSPFLYMFVLIFSPPVLLLCSLPYRLLRRIKSLRILLKKFLSGIRGA